MGSSGVVAVVPRTRRGRERREAVLDAAAELFLRHGFHGTSIDDIGAAAGITGPGVYRHVASKDALLMAVLDRLWEALKPAVRAAGQAPPEDALGLLLDAHIGLALDQPAALTLLIREQRHLPADYLANARRNHRRYVDAWVGPLCTLAPGLDRATARATALAVHGLVDSARLEPGILASDAHRALLRNLAMAAIARTLGR
jgi:AcrR family transcriptional regulator